MSLGLPHQIHHKYLLNESHTKERREGSGVSTQHDHPQIHESQGRILGVRLGGGEPVSAQGP